MYERTAIDSSAQRLFDGILRSRDASGMTVAMMLAKLSQAVADGGRVSVDPQNFRPEQAAAAAVFAEFINGASGSEMS